MTHIRKLWQSGGRLRSIWYSFRWGRIGFCIRKRSRDIDREVLFVSLRSHAKNAIPAGTIEPCIADAVVDAKFQTSRSLHCLFDPAWRFRDEWSEEQDASDIAEGIDRIVDGMLLERNP